jgi:hypothetical protein
VIWLENKPLHSYFAHSPKRFTKLAELMQTKGNTIIWNVKTKWISMLSFAKRVMEKYMILLVKMALESPTN